MKKKRLKNKILTALVVGFITFFPIILLGTGVLAVTGFALAIVDHAAEFVTGVKDAIAGKGIEESITLADLSSYDIDKMLDIVDDKKVITDKLLDQMMMERGTLKEILKKTKEYNETYDTAKKKIEAKHIYTVEEITNADKINGYGAATQKPETKLVQKTEYVKMDYPVSAEPYEKAYHNVNWQSVYLTAVEETIQNYGANIQAQRTAGDTSEDASSGNSSMSGASDEDGETNEPDEDFKNASTSNATSLGQFEAGWQPQSTYQRTQEAKYRVWIEKYASMYNLPPDLVRAIITKESNWNPKASSGVANGLCQFTHAAWKDVGMQECGYSESDVWEPEYAIHACARLIARNIKYYDGDVLLGIAAYNMGSGNVDKWIKNGTLNDYQHWYYTAKVLTYFTGRTYTANQLAAGNYVGGDRISVSLGYGTITASGRISLTEDQIDELILQFEPKYDYIFDVVRDENDFYDFSACQELPNYGKQVSGDPNTKEGQYIWYNPVSSLASVQTPYMDVSYTPLNVVANHVIRLDRWESMIRFYWPHYDGKLFKALVEFLPKGEDATERYEYYASIASDIIEYDGSMFAPDSAGGFDYSSVASGNYTPLSGVSPSIKIPENCGGMSIPLYLQYDSRWGRIPFGGGTISSSGCGATSIAMVLSYELDKSIYPNDVVALIGNRYYVAGAGQSWGMIPAVASMFGCSAKQETVSADKIMASLKAGHPVIVSTSGYGTRQEFTKHGHYIVLRGLTSDGKVLVNDPNDNASSKKHYAKAYDAQFIYSECCNNGSPKVMYTIYGPKEN